LTLVTELFFFGAIYHTRGKRPAREKKTERERERERGKEKVGKAE